MTVGEKIQYYRKKIGLSQEELGQKMLVSRQTVSLWEMDKTLPTVDNLIRLKEIFSVSIDDILSEAEPIEENENEPKEAYVFKYKKFNITQNKMSEVDLAFFLTHCFYRLCFLFLFCFVSFSRKSRNAERIEARAFTPTKLNQIPSRPKLHSAPSRSTGNTKATEIDRMVACSGFPIALK